MVGTRYAMSAKGNNINMYVDTACRVPTGKNKHKNMKKTYITPSVETIKVSAVNMLAASTNLQMFSEDEVNTSEAGVQLGREDNTPSRPNLWEQGW